MRSVIRLTSSEFNFRVAARVPSEQILQLNSGENIIIYVYVIIIYIYNNNIHIYNIYIIIYI